MDRAPKGKRISSAEIPNLSGKRTGPEWRETSVDRSFESIKTPARNLNIRAGVCFADKKEEKKRAAVTEKQADGARGRMDYRTFILKEAAGKPLKRQKVEEVHGSAGGITQPDRTGA